MSDLKTSAKQKSGNSISAKERRRLDAEKRKADKAARKGIEDQVAKLEAEIVSLEDEQSEISQQLEAPETYNDPEKAKELNIRAGRISKRLEEKNYEWEIAAEQLSQLLDAQATE